ncbi:hypothetical protein [Burkholderia sp. 22PA0106]|uniref:hypothetical protein n=1 Tax=Burkholderia sp. 22PA0106 TaxID=3237371 RepID=UPI0039C3B225
MEIVSRKRGSDSPLFGRTEVSSYDGDLMKRIAWCAAWVHDALSEKLHNARDEP